MPRLLLAVSFVLLLMMTAVWTGAAQQPGAADLEAARFTGKTTVLEPGGVGVTRRRFEAGGLRMQKRGQAIKEMSPGESDFTPANVEHWHGAAATTPLTHVAVGFGGDTRWLGK